MAQPGDVTVINTLAIQGGVDIPIIRDTEMGGGSRVVADIAARDAIPTGLRSEGMYVHTVATGDTFSLGAGLTNADWNIVANAVGRVMFQPGGPVNTGPIYNDWATLFAAVEARGIPTIIDGDPSFGTVEIPLAGSPWNFSKPVFLWGPMTSGSFLQFENGAQLSNVAEVRGFILNCPGGSATSCINVPNPGGGINIVDGYIQGGRVAVEILAGRLRLVNTDLDGSSGGFSAGSILIASLLGSSDIPPNKVNGAGNFSFEINADSFVDPTQTGSGGTVTFSYQDPTQQGFVELTAATASLDGRRAYVFNSAGGFSQALPDPSTVFGPMKLKNIGAGTITLTGFTANPSSIASGESFIFQSDGTRWEGF